MLPKICARSSPVRAVGNHIFFLGSGHAAKHGITVRKPTELLDHLMMFAGEFEPFGVARSLKQGEGQVLIGPVLAMHEWHIEETPPCAADLHIISMRDRATRYIPRQSVRSKGISGAAKHVTGQLIEQDNRGQRVIGSILEIGSGLAFLLTPQMGEFLGAYMVQLWIMAPPPFFAHLIEPEIKQRGRPIGGHGIMAVGQHVHA